MSYLAKSLSRVQRIESQHVIGDFKGTFSEVSRGKQIVTYWWRGQFSFSTQTHGFGQKRHTYSNWGAMCQVWAYSSVISVIIKLNDYYCLKKKVFIWNIFGRNHIPVAKYISVSAGRLFYTEMVLMYPPLCHFKVVQSSLYNKNDLLKYQSSIAVKIKGDH